MSLSDKQAALDAVKILALHKARQTTNTSPTEGQKRTGNYRKGKVKLRGFQIAIENPIGSVRSGVDKDGKEWRSIMHRDYGYFVGSKAVDGDPVDVFIGDDPENDPIWVVDQVDGEGKFDEPKVILGAKSEEEARELYLNHYPEGWKGLGAITKMADDEFRTWLEAGTCGAVKKASSSWIGFDLDGTLAKAEDTFDPESIGAPVAAMIEKLREHLAAGDTCKIFTARCYKDEALATRVIQDWLEEQGLPRLDVTNIKDPSMELLYDDRAISVKRNEGTTKKAAAAELLERPCCGAGCENCPYDPPHQEGNTVVREDLKKEAADPHPYGVVCAVCEGTIVNRNRGKQPHYQCENGHVCDDARHVDTKEVIRYTGGMRLNGEAPITMEMAKSAKTINRKTRMVEQHTDHCPHCDHEFTEKGYPRPDFSQLPEDEAERHRMILEGECDEICPNCKGVVDPREVSDEDIEAVRRGWGGDSVAEDMLRRRSNQRRRIAEREKRAAAPDSIASAMAEAGIPSDAYFFTGPGGRATAYLGDWHPREVQEAMDRLGAKFFKAYEAPGDSEIGKPEWATGKISSGATSAQVLDNLPHKCLEETCRACGKSWKSCWDLIPDEEALAAHEPKERRTVARCRSCEIAAAESDMKKASTNPPPEKSIGEKFSDGLYYLFAPLERANKQIRQGNPGGALRLETPPQRPAPPSEPPPESPPAGRNFLRKAGAAVPSIDELKGMWEKGEDHRGWWERQGGLRGLGKKYIGSDWKTISQNAVSAAASPWTALPKFGLGLQLNAVDKSLALAQDAGWHAKRLWSGKAEGPRPSAAYDPVQNSEFYKGTGAGQQASNWLFGGDVSDVARPLAGIANRFTGTDTTAARAENDGDPWKRSSEQPTLFGWNDPRLNPDFGTEPQTSKIYGLAALRNNIRELDRYGRWVVDNALFVPQLAGEAAAVGTLLARNAVGAPNQFTPPAPRPPAEGGNFWQNSRDDIWNSTFGRFADLSDWITNPSGRDGVGARMAKALRALLPSTTPQSLQSRRFNHRGH